MMGLEDRLRSATLLTLGATLPLLGLALTGLLALELLLLPWRPLRWAAAPAALLLLANALRGTLLFLKTFRRPPGRRLAPGEAPALEEHLDRLREEWEGPASPAIILAPDAWSVELTGVPAAGLLGWNRYHWYVGIYPLLALGRREFEAVAAWEVAFWSDLHGWFNLQVKRLAVYWYRLHLHLQLKARGGWTRPGWWTSLLLRPYAAWFVDRVQPFLAREFVRTDRAIAASHGAATLGRALCRLAIVQPLATRRAFSLWSACIEGGRPLPEDLYRELAAVLARTDGAEGMLELALDGIQREAPPLLRLRLEYLGTRPEVPLPPSDPAFRTLLEGTAVMDEVHGLWKARMEEGAAQAEVRNREASRRYRELNASLRGSFPDHPDSPELLALAFQHAPWDEFDLLLRMFRLARPRSVRAGFLAVRRSLQRGRDLSAVREARDLLVRDPLLAPACHELLARHLWEQGDGPNADREWNRALRAETVAEGVRRERRGASLRDELGPYPCDWATLQAIQALCRSRPEVRAAWLVRKRTAYPGACPVLLLVVDGGGWSPGGRRRLARRLQSLCPVPDGAALFVEAAAPFARRRWKAKLEAADGLIFRR